ncbi:MAG: Hsp20 family protein [Gemmatimonadaceae bacterium]|jgi:HSP20 family protein|nr:Hsp20 family protein [Gemmatimonadaceae bacterium]
MTYYRIPAVSPAPVTALRREMDRLFEEVFAGRPATSWQPAVQAREDEQGYTIALDVPGIPADRLEVLAEDGVLTVRGERVRLELAEGERLLIGETTQGQFVRQFRLPKSADLQAIQAAYDLGVLTVRVAKLAPAQPRRVPVSVQSPAVTMPTSQETAAA